MYLEDLLHSLHPTCTDLLFFFSAIAFLAFTITGRFTESACMLLMFLLLMMPLSAESDKDGASDEISGPVTNN